VARQHGAGFDIRLEGHRAGEARMLVYASTETHSWLKKACEFLGLGRNAVRLVPVDAEYRVDVAAMERMIAEDRAAGHRPFCVMGTTGTVQTGATDDLVALADLAKRERLWFHVDGAFGAMAALSDELASVTRGMERADSIAFDLHKWGYLPYGIACVLVRDDSHLVQAYAFQAAYLANEGRGLNAGGGLQFSDRGIELSRDFKALKAWMQLRATGTEEMGRQVARNVRQAKHLESLVKAHPELESLAPVPLNVVNFRFVPRSRTLEAPALDALNREILIQLQERGIAVPSGTTLGGRFAIRVANTNHRSTDEDFEVLVNSVVGIGHEVLQRT
jgi:aromatic-L-amino-acid decarboxylase